MSYSAPNRLLMPGRHSIDTVSTCGSLYVAASWALNGAWPSANLAIYVPVVVPSRVVVVKLWFASGSTATGNVDMGVYDASGTAVVSATNATKAGAGEQVFDVTDTTIGPGLYYIGLSSDSATDTFQRASVAAPIPLGLGLLSETSAYPLPAAATWTAGQTLAYIPIVGMLLEGTAA